MTVERQPFYASKTAIYEWLYSIYGQRYCHLLPAKQYRKKPRKKGNKTRRAMIPNRIGIEAKPPSYQHQFGHLEHDTFVSGKKTGSKVAGSVLYEPLALYVALEKIPNLKPRVNERAVQTMLKNFTDVKSITRDNGIENRCHELTPVDSYFCDPYSAWQKPYVEQVIKTLRRFFKKGCDLSAYANEQMSFVQAILNNKPRKNLGYKTPLEVMLEHGMLNGETLNRWESFLAKETFTSNKHRVSVAIGG
jgi:IS30 family transposase